MDRPTPFIAPYPVDDIVDGVRDALREHGHAVVTAEPGAGKTTIVPLRLLGEPWLQGQRMMMLEPRRIATRAAARRMADLLGESVGGTVGYRTRDERHVSDRTLIEVVTEGILTRRLQHDPELAGIGLVIFDEFHERSIHADLGLALTLDVKRSIRPDLRLLVMSATIDAAKVAALLGGGSGPGASAAPVPAPVLAAAGRTHPVEVIWAPKRPKEWIEPAMAALVSRALREQPEGDLLAFLPGAAEIRRTADLLSVDAAVTGFEVVPLYGALPSADQDAAIAPPTPGRLRRVVLSTDIAETSLTVEGVRVVVDAGLARQPRFDTGTGMTRLVTVSGSKASADQRAGRAGRVAPGVAYRLWSKMEQASRRPFADAEVTQVDLAGLLLELAAWGSPDPSTLPFLDPPPKRAVDEARTLLQMLGALDAEGHITIDGRAMVELPLHPRLARMVLSREWTACSLAALLEERDVLRGKPDELPTDLTLRLELLDDATRRHPLADGRALRQARERARDLARRIGIDVLERSDTRNAGRLLALAYPDRIAGRRDALGRFVLRTGSGAWTAQTDPLARESMIVAADLDGQRKDARVRLGAPIDADQVLELFADQIETSTRLSWDKARDDLVSSVERRLGLLRLGIIEGRAQPSPSTTAALLERVRSTRLAVLSWTDAARAFQARAQFVGRHTKSDASWPDLADGALIKTLDTWFAPFLGAKAVGRADLEAVDVLTALRTRLTHEQRRDLDRLAPTHTDLPTGRRVAIDYSHDPPMLAVRVQEMFGVTAHPMVLGGALPVAVHLLSPAGRPVQITSDLLGFWKGSWKDVRKDMAGRYPKHRWPEDPTAP